MRHQLSTDDVNGRDSFTYWQDVICDTFINLDCSSANPNQFTGRLHSTSFADLQLSSMASDEIYLSRSKSRINAAREEYGLVVVQGRGQTLAEQDGRQVVLEAGDITLFDSVRPYQAQLQSGFHHFVLKIPRDKLRQRLGPLEAATAIRISGRNGIGRIVSSFIRALPLELNSFDLTTSEQVANSCIDLVAAALGDAISDIPTNETTTKIQHVIRAKSFIATNIQSSDLSPEYVARELGITTRYLSTIFTTETLSLSKYIWKLRLDRCKTALSDSKQAHRSVSEIAFGWGFNDMSHFSRVFRQETGFSPSEFRSLKRQDL